MNRKRFFADVSSAQRRREPAPAVSNRLARLPGPLTPTHPDYADNNTISSALTSQNSPTGRITPPST
jgi:hypothetical protein